MVTVRDFRWGGNDYREFCRLRQEYLRAPLGLDIYAEDLDAERTQLLFGLYDGAALIGGAIVVPLSEHRAQLRQMLVVQDSQGRGLGRLLVEHVEAALRGRGIRLLSMNARLEAVGFYERCGYERVGDEFVHVTIPHVRMEKAL